MQRRKINLPSIFSFQFHIGGNSSGRRHSAPAWRPKNFFGLFSENPPKTFFSNISTKGQISHIGSSIILVENKSGRKPQAKGLKPMQYKSLIVLVSVGSVSFAVVSVSSLLLVGR